MSTSFALTAARIFDGETWHRDTALLVRDGQVDGLVAPGSVPEGVALVDCGVGTVAPGFVDLQVNGGGGVMLNDRQDVDAIRTICAAHARFGTTALLPTLITDTPKITADAVAAGIAAHAAAVPGFIGLHLEGPHLSVGRKGAHDPALIRPMSESDEAALVASRARLPALLTTVAPESVTADQVGRLAAAGIVVSLGHSDASYATARAYAAAGASMATHLFNAMSQIGNREAGLAGAAIDQGGLWAGLIADGIHVDVATMGIALRAKRGPSKIFLVTDAMATIGTDMTEFALNGRVIQRRDGRLTLEDGTLAGADLDMISAVRFVHGKLGLDLGEALRMASLYPAQAMGIDPSHGRLRKGSRADLVHLTADLGVGSLWISGKKVFAAA